VVPIEPPAEIKAMLPELLFLERPAPSLRQRLAGLAVAAQWYLSQRDAIATVPGDQHPRLLDLKELLRARMRRTEDEIREAVRTAAEEVAGLGGAPDDATKEAREGLHGWLSALEEAVASDVIDDDSHARWESDRISALVASAALVTG